MDTWVCICMGLYACVHVCVYFLVVDACMHACMHAWMDGWIAVDMCVLSWHGHRHALGTAHGTPMITSMLPVPPEPRAPTPEDDNVNVSFSTGFRITRSGLPLHARFSNSAALVTRFPVDRNSGGNWHFGRGSELLHPCTEAQDKVAKTRGK